MTVYELMRANETQFRLLGEVAPKLHLIAYLDLFKEFKQLKKEGYKVSYLAATLSDKYNISERNFYKIIRRFNEPVNIE